ncbi:hypothetical protein [Propionicicella superfundia]|uniref:hypothetical protein n=1 Tax=Propionicicella superfundia TaxID=348582 RepID=UPI0003F70018|nr:hypothetical protein [Propionicicella superfundia]
MRRSARRIIVAIAATATIGLSSIAVGGIGHQNAGQGDTPQDTSSVQLAGQGDWPFKWGR